MSKITNPNKVFLSTNGFIYAHESFAKQIVQIFSVGPIFIDMNPVGKEGEYQYINYFPRIKIRVPALHTWPFGGSIPRPKPLSTIRNLEEEHIIKIWPTLSFGLCARNCW